MRAFPSFPALGEMRALALKAAYTVRHKAPYDQLCVCAQPCPALCDPLGPVRLLCPHVSAGKRTSVGSHSHFQGIFPAQASNPTLLHLLHWQADSSPLCHEPVIIMVAGIILIFAL